jgi:hypothetical protein
MWTALYQPSGLKAIHGICDARGVYLKSASDCLHGEGAPAAEENEHQHLIARERESEWTQHLVCTCQQKLLGPHD